MPNATITSTENTFGTISGTFASDQSTITGTISGIITGTLDGSIGVPGPQGIQGPTGPAGEGVVAGGSANQVLSKIDSTNYNTQWSDPVLFDGGTITGPITMENETDRTVTSAYAYSAENVNNNQQNSSLSYGGLNVTNGESHIIVTATAITFPDSTTQSTSATNLGYITDAPADGPIYGRVNNSWSPVYAFTGGPITSAITFTDGSTVTGFESGSFYVNRTDGYSAALQLNSLSLSSDTQSIGIAAAGITFADASFQSTAATPFDGGDITGPITMHNGSYDSEMSASVFGVELTSDTTQNASLAYNGLNVQITGSAMNITATGVTFPDSSTQTVAFPGWDSPALTGTPTAPTATLGDDSTQIATTAFVQDAVISGSAHAETLQATVRNNTGSTLASFTVVYISGAVGNKAAVAKAQANSEATSAGTFAVTESSIANNANGIVISAGVLSNVDTSAFTDGDKLYLSPTVAGGVTTTKPSAPNHLVYVGVVTRSHPTLGTVSVRIQNGYELYEIHDVAIASVADKDLLTYETSTTLWKNKSFSTLGLATLASPTFTGTPTLPTGTIATTQSPGNNTTALATTAFVTAAVPAFATNAQAISQSSTTTAITPASTIYLLLSSKSFSLISSSIATSISGTGAAAGSATFPFSRTLTAPNVATVGYATMGNRLWYMPTSALQQVNFATPIGISSRVYWIGGGGTYPNVVARNVVRSAAGMGTVSTAPGTLADKGFGWEYNFNTGVMSLIAHNGTTLSSVTVTMSPTVAFGFTHDIAVVSDGAGTVTMFLNGSSVGSTTGGPVGVGAGAYAQWEIQNMSVSATTGNVTISFGNTKMFC